MSTPPARPTPLEPEGPSPFRLFLERLQLWPPSGDGDAEARLGAWWATRLGTLLAVIGVVFLGVYVSRDVAPWIRFVELLAVSLGATVLGLWVERKVEKFGAVVFGGGLALLYYCAYAAYAVAPVKVIESVAVAAAWQLAAVGLVIAASVWRRSPVVATMAVALGFVTAIFSRAGGLNAFALCSALLLAAAAVGFHRKWRWEGPAFLALPATYGIYALLFVDWRQPLPGAASWWEWPFIATALLLFFARDWRTRRAAALDVDWRESTFQGLNSSLAAIVGVATALLHYPEELKWFYFTAAAVFAGLAALRSAQVKGDVISSVFLAKAAGALTLGVIETVEGRTTAIALLVQAWVMLFIAWRLRSRVLAVGTGLVATIAAAYFLGDLDVAVAFATLTTAGQIGFIAGLALLGTEMARRLVFSGKGQTGLLVEGLAAIAAGLLGLLAADSWLPAAWTPAMMMSVVAVLAVAAAGRRAWGPAVAAIIPLAAANVRLWGLASNEFMDTSLWWNALAVLAPTIAVGAAAGGLRMGWPLQSLGGGARAAGAIIWAVALIGLELVFFQVWSGAVPLAATMGLALLLQALVARWPERHLDWLAVGAGLLAVLLWVREGVGVLPPVALAIGVLTGWAVVVIPQGWSRLRNIHERVVGGAWQQGLCVVAALGITIRAIDWFAAGGLESLVFAFAALAIGALVLWPGVARASEASWVLWVATGLTLRPLPLPATQPAVWALAFVGVLAWIPVVVVARSQRIVTWWSSGQTWWRMAGPVQALLATWLAIRVAGHAGPPDVGMWWVLAAVGCALVAGEWSRALPARVAAVALALWAGWEATGVIGGGYAEGWSRGMVGTLAVAASGLILPVVLARGEGTFSAGALRHLRRWLPAMGMALAFVVFAVQEGAWRSYATVGWGLTAGVAFVVGLVARSRPHRLLGLIGLALCVPRVFVVDLSSTLHRIIAFVVLGVVLLWVGFSYQRFRHLITESDPDDVPGKGPSAS